MSAKRSRKSRLRKFILAGVLTGLLIVLTPIIYFFVVAWFTFDSHCREDSPPVALARSLSQEQLAELHARVISLSEQYPYDQLTNFQEPFIPNDLKYLDARYITLDGEYSYVVLAKCNVSVGVTLFFERSRDGQDIIELKWDAATTEDPYQSGSEILWASAG